MCGLYGIFSNKTMGRDHVSAFKTMAFCSLARGLDSAGYALAYKKKSKETKKTGMWVLQDKAALNAGLFYDMPSTNKTLSRAGKVALMGHNRDATKGEVTNAGAHPYGHGSIIGCHNGTIHDHKYSPNDKFVSDSDRLFYNIAQDGLEETTKDIFNGALALSYIDLSDSSLNFVRNGKRPLIMMWSKDGKTLMWASEEEFLHYGACQLEKIDWDKPDELKTETLLSISMWSGDMSTEEVVLEAPFQSATSRGSHDVRSKGGGKDVVPFRADNSNARTTSVPETGSALKKEELAKSGDAVFYQDAETEKEMVCYSCDGGVISHTTTLTVYEKMLNRGCLWCSSPQQAHDRVRWVDAGSYVCEDCYTDPNFCYMWGELENVGDNSVLEDLRQSTETKKKGILI